MKKKNKQHKKPQSNRKGVTQNYMKQNNIMELTNYPTPPPPPPLLGLLLKLLKRVSPKVKLLLILKKESCC